MGYGMGRGMGPGMGHGGMMQVVFAIMDANGDGSLSLQEVQDVHARIFAHMDEDDDGQVTKAEIKAFFGAGKDRWDDRDDDDNDDNDD
jgi:Ca2+-binding EF-hand superfamily protein